MSKLLTEKQAVAIIRIKLPLVVEALSSANLEAQKKDVDVSKLRELLLADEIDGFYDACDLLDGLKKLEAKQ